MESSPLFMFNVSVIVDLYKSCFTNSVKGIGIFSLAISGCMLNVGYDLIIWINSSLVTVVCVGLSCFSTVMFSFSIGLKFPVWVSCALLLLIFFSGIVCEAVDVLSGLELSAGVFEVLVFGSTDLGSTEGFLGSKFVVLTELEAFAAAYFYESFVAWATSSVI